LPRLRMRGDILFLTMCVFMACTDTVALVLLVTYFTAHCGSEAAWHLLLRYCSGTVANNTFFC
jgi:ABC-type maltose transport system permease subunit